MQKSGVNMGFKRGLESYFRQTYKHRFQHRETLCCTSDLMFSSRLVQTAHECSIWGAYWCISDGSVKLQPFLVHCVHVRRVNSLKNLSALQKFSASQCIQLLLTFQLTGLFTGKCFESAVWPHGRWVGGTHGMFVFQASQQFCCSIASDKFVDCGL